MIVLALLLAGMSVWNFIVGMWAMGTIAAIFSIWAVVELFTEDDDIW